MRTATLLTLLALLLPSCGGSSDPGELTNEGYAALGSGDFEGAQTDFEAALAAIGANIAHADYVRAKLGSIEASTRLDPARAKRDFLALAEAMPDKVTDRDFNRIGGRLGDAGHYDEAVALVQVGKQKYPDSKHLDTLVQRLGDEAKASGDSSALDALRGLGYVGD